MDLRVVVACVNYALELFEYDELLLLLDGELDEYVPYGCNMRD